METNEEDRRRKIVVQGSACQFLKPKDIDESGRVIEWHAYGQNKSWKATYDSIQRREYDFVITEETAQGLRKYEKQKEERDERFRESRLPIITEQK